MIWNRREVLAGLGVASAQAMLAACGGGGAKPVRHAARDEVGDVRSWLRAAVATMRGAFPIAHALAVSARRTTAAIDVLGPGVGRSRCDGVVLAVATERGERREHVTSDLSADGIAAAVHALVGAPSAANVDFGAPQVAAGTADPREWTDVTLLARVGDMVRLDRAMSSRIVYAASLIDIDDAIVWSIAPGRDLEQRLVRVRRVASRVAWNGTRPVVTEAVRAWRGGVDDHTLDAAEIEQATNDALALMTPGTFDDSVRDVVLDPHVAATVVDAAVRALLTTTAGRRPEVAHRLAVGAKIGSPAITLTDDPTTPGAYGGFTFDDAGEPAAPVALVDRGHVAGRLERGLRPGHVGPSEPAASHLRLAPGAIAREALLDDGFSLEGGLGAVVDPASGQVVISIGRARELRKRSPTGRVFADVELVGDLAGLLAAISGASKETTAIGLREDGDGGPMWRSIETPWLRGKGMLRARRRRA